MAVDDFTEWAVSKTDKSVLQMFYNAILLVYLRDRRGGKGCSVAQGFRNLAPVPLNSQLAQSLRMSALTCPGAFLSVPSSLN